MIYLAGGSFEMGSDRFYPEERPLRKVHVDAFLIDPTPVTNLEFSQFVEATGHITSAEIPPNPADYPGMPVEMAKPGSLLFTQPAPTTYTHPDQSWWTFSFGTDWRHPEGPKSNLDGLENHPVVHVAYEDAVAYATWSGKSLPTEAEWEFAARGGAPTTDYAWGDQLAPDGSMLANYWQGAFPLVNEALDGWERTSPVRSFPPNAFGLFDMIGNVWEWTADWYTDNLTTGKPEKSCCIPRNPTGALESQSYDPQLPNIRIGRKVLKGGSHLCAENYCQRYRPAARYPQTVDTSTSHIGFRCVRRP
jgi:sulfatase modifying factor 1